MVLAHLRSPLGRVWRVVAFWTVLGAAGSVVKIAADADAAIGWLPQTVSYWSSVTIPSAMVGAGLGAWLVVPLRRREFRDRRAASARTWPEVLSHAVLLPCLSMVVGGTTSLLVAVGWSTAIGAAYPVALAQSVLWWLGSIAASCVLSLLGCALGWIIPGVAGVAVAPAVAYVALVGPMMTMGQPPWAGLYAVVGMPWLERVPTLASAVLRAAFWLLLLTAGVLLVSRHRRLAWAAALAACLTASVAMAAGPRSSPVAEAAATVCQGDQPHVCTRGMYAVGLPRFATILSEGYALLPEQLRSPTVVTDEGLRAQVGPDALVFGPSAGNSSPTNLPDRASTLADLGRWVMFQGCGPHSDPTASLVLVVWWRSALQIPLDEPVRPGDLVPSRVLVPDEYALVLDRANTLSELPDQTRVQWFRDHATDISTCTLDPSALPGAK